MLISLVLFNVIYFLFLIAKQELQILGDDVYCYIMLLTLWCSHIHTHSYICVRKIILEDNFFILLWIEFY